MKLEDLKPDSSFDEVLRAAIDEFSNQGYVSEERLMLWITVLRNAAERDVGPDWQDEVHIRQGFDRLVEQFVNGVKLPQRIEGVGAFTKEMVKPKLYAELDRRIINATKLIKVNKREAVNTTLKRFRGWATSIPIGGTRDADRRDIKKDLSASMRDFTYQRRLVNNDQGHKLIANIANVVAVEAGAIAAIWHSHGTSDRSYNARKEHLKWDGKTYIIRHSWAHDQGLIKSVYGYTDQKPMPGEDVNCRCWYTYLTSPRKLPEGFLTRKGKDWVQAGADKMQRIA